MNLIVAVNGDWGIGYNNTQSIVLPEDRQSFKRLTTGGIVIAGRKTFEDFGRPLPNRVNIILTRNRDFKADGVYIAHSVDEALAMVPGEATDKVFVIGGGSIYEQFLPMCTYAYVTKLETSPPSDTYFPDLDASPAWLLEIRGETRISCDIRYSFNIYTRTMNK